MESLARQGRRPEPATRTVWAGEDEAGYDRGEYEVPTLTGLPPDYLSELDWHDPDDYHPKPTYEQAIATVMAVFA